MAVSLLIIRIVKIQSLIRQLVTLRHTLFIESHFLGLIYLCLVPVKEIVSRGNCLVTEIRRFSRRRCNQPQRHSKLSSPVRIHRGNDQRLYFCTHYVISPQL